MLCVAKSHNLALKKGEGAVSKSMRLRFFFPSFHHFHQFHQVMERLLMPTDNLLQVAAPAFGDIRFSEPVLSYQCSFGEVSIVCTMGPGSTRRILFNIKMLISYNRYSGMATITKVKISGGVIIADNVRISINAHFLYLDRSS